MAAGNTMMKIIIDCVGGKVILDTTGSVLIVDGVLQNTLRIIIDADWLKVGTSGSRLIVDGVPT